MFESLESLESLDVIKWAFSFGYELGNRDFSEGIHINSIEMQKNFIAEITELMEGD